jgi:hypothetical protein
MKNGGAAGIETNKSVSEYFTKTRFRPVKIGIYSPVGFLHKVSIANKSESFLSPFVPKFLCRRAVGIGQKFPVTLI